MAHVWRVLPAARGAQDVRGAGSVLTAVAHVVIAVRERVAELALLAAPLVDVAHALRAAENVAIVATGVVENAATAVTGAAESAGTASTHVVTVVDVTNVARPVPAEIVVGAVTLYLAARALVATELVAVVHAGLANVVR